MGLERDGDIVKLELALVLAGAERATPGAKPSPLASQQSVQPP